MKTFNVCTRNRMLTLSLGALLGLAGAACDGAPVDEPAPPAPTTPASDDVTPTPVASVALDSGQVVEFYEMGEGAMLMEAGPAGAKTVIGALPELRADQLTDVWHSLAPDRSAPKALVDFQARLMKAAGGAQPLRLVQPRANVAPDFGGEAIEPEPVVAPEGTLAAPVGCNNGCCDWDWLKGFLACGGGEYEWLLYNYGYSYGRASDVYAFAGMACSASGTSTYKITIEGGGGGTWSVPQATYRTYRYYAPFCCDDPNIRATVNSSTNQHLHTHCGSVWY